MTRRLVYKIILFIILFFVIDHAIGGFIERHGLAHNERTVRNIYQQKEKLDILFVGSSHAYSAINPEIFAEKNLKTINLGLATAGPIYYTYMIRAFLEHNEAPRKIIIEAAYQDFTDKSDNLSYGYFTYLDIQNRLAYYLEKRDYKSFLFSLSRTFLNRDIFFSAVDVYLGKKEKARWSNGFIYTEGTIEDDIVRAKDLETYYNYFKDNPHHLLEEKFQSFSHILSSLKKSGIDVVIVDLPEYYILKEDLAYQPLRTEFVQKIADMANQFGYSFIDFNATESCDDLRKDKRLFRSVDHLNWHGGKVFSLILLSSLNESS